MLSFFITAPLVLSCLVSLKKKERKELSTKGQSRDAHIQGCTKDADNILQEYTETAIKHVHLSFFTMEWGVIGSWMTHEVLESIFWCVFFELIVSFYCKVWAHTHSKSSILFRNDSEMLKLKRITWNESMFQRKINILNSPILYLREVHTPAGVTCSICLPTSINHHIIKWLQNG